MVRARGRLCGGVSVGRARLAGNIGPILAECYNDLVELFRDTPLDCICWQAGLSSLKDLRYLISIS